MEKLKAGWIGILPKDEDYLANLEKLAALGYRSMECGEELLEMGDQAISRVRDMGIEIHTVPADIKDLGEEACGRIVEKARRLGSRMATVFACSVNASFWGGVPSYDQAMADFEAMEKAAKFLAGEGITLCYHNHYQDFLTSFNGIKAFDLLLANTEQLKIELDAMWAHNGLEDPARLLRRIAPRLADIHIKDYLPGEPREEGGAAPIFVSVGNGVVPLAQTLEAAQQAGVKWAIVEQDQLYKLSPMESLTAAYFNMKETGFVE